MLSALAQTVRQYDLLPSGCHVVAGVSGGADSVALLYALHTLRPRLDFSLTAAHLNHGLRGSEADADAAFVQMLAWRLGVPCVVERADVPALARARGWSVEMAGRDARYAFLARVAAQAGADRVATGHQADDQVETLLLRLLRGAGPSSLGGMAYRSERKGLCLIRPMLDVRHAEAMAFLESHGLKWREDASNTDPSLLRNRVRLELLPFLEERFGGQVRKSLLRTAMILRDEQAWTADVVAPLFRKAVAEDGGLQAGRWSAWPTAVRRRVLLRWLMDGGVDPARLDFALLERVLAWCAGSAPRLSLPSRFFLERSGGHIHLRPAASPAGSTGCWELPVPGRLHLREPAWTLSARKGRGFGREPAAVPGPGLFRAHLSESRRAGAPLVVRTRRPGDRMKPWGLEGSVKLQDILVDLKVPRAWRDRIPVVLCRGEIVWLPGYRIARDWAVPGPRAPSVCLTVRLT